MRQTLLLIAMAIVGAAITMFEPRFLTVSNWLNIMDQAVIIGIVAVGVVLLMIGGGFDLSVGSSVVLSGYIIAISFANGVPTLLAIVLALLGGLLLGVINGAGVAYLRIPSFIMTLGTLYAVRGFILFLSRGETIGHAFPASFTVLGKGNFASVPIPVFILLAIYIVLHIVLKKTRFGRHTIAVGSDAETSRRLGINSRLHLAKLYVLCGTLAALAGLLLSSRINASTSDMGLGYELEAIAAVVIGGTSLFGGAGTVAGTLLGVVFLGMVHNGINMIGVSPYLATFAVGALLLFSASVDVVTQWSRRNSK
jgi:ribose/xylose/arabinose/galactoside ABC-type transport system permease subunit